MIGKFFIWCAGSDKAILTRCSDAEKTKHIGYGTLVLIPPILAFISMSYAVSTIDLIKDQKEIAYIIGFIWALIIFAFDRFIVSTHRRKERNLKEVVKPSFILRFIFALVLGITVSHPLVMLWFDGSITQEIVKSRDYSITEEVQNFHNEEDKGNVDLDSLKSYKQCWQKLLAAEQSGDKITLPCGSSSGLPRYGKRAEEIKLIIIDIDQQIADEVVLVNQRVQFLESKRDSTIANLKDYSSFDYLQRELILEELKENNPIISLTQLMLMLLFVLVDLLPMIFKTFAPFGLYDKYLLEFGIEIKELEKNDLKSILQQAFDHIANDYGKNKDINISEEEQRRAQERKEFRLKIQRNILIGLLFSIVVIFFFFAYRYYLGESSNEIEKKFMLTSFFLPLFIAILGGTILQFISSLKSKK